MSFKKHNIFTSLLILSIVVLCAQTHASSEDRKKRHRKPPLEAFEACADLSEEQACSFVGRRDNTVEGTCIVLPFDEEALVCKPAHRRKKQHRKPSLEAFEACANLSEEQACSFVGRRDNTVEGTCIVLPFDEEAMVCKPAHRRKKHRNQDSIE